MNTEEKLKLFVKSDAVYQGMLLHYQRIEEDFVRIRNSLSKEDQERLDRYISLGEEMDHRRVILALSFAKEPAHE